MTHVRKIKSGGVNTTWQNFVGEVGTLFYDHTLGNLRLSDGHTPGGVAPAIYATTATFAQSFNTATLVAQAVSANTATIAQSVVGGIGVATLTVGTGTFISTTTGAVTIWVSTASAFNTSTLVSLAVTSTFAQSFNTSTLVAQAVSANTASGNFTVPGNLNVNGGTIYNNGYALTTATSFNTSTLVAIAVTSTFAQSFNTSTLVALAVTATFAQSFNTATLVANAVTATTVSGAAQPNITSVGTLTSLIVSGEIVAQKLTIELTTVTTTLIKTDDVIQTTNTTAATGTTTGALVIAGGVGVGGNLYVGGAIQGTFTFANSGTTSAYASKRVLQYNESTKEITYSNTLDAVRPYITGYSSEIHVSPVAADDTGNGTIGDPVKTIAQAQALAALAFETTGVGERKSIILHPGNYTENVTIDTQYTVLTTHELVGKNTTLAGTLTITKGCTIDGLKMHNLVISATSANGTVDIIGCTVSTATTKTSSAYTVFRGCDLSSSSLNITGAGSVVMVGGNYFTVTVNNAAAGVLAKAVITMGPVTLTAGTMQISDTLVYAATTTSNAITQSAGSVLTLNNSQTLIPDLSNVARNSFGGFYSILHSVYDKPNTTFGGTSLNAISYSQVINADKLTLLATTVSTSTNTGALVITGGVGVGGGMFVGGTVTATNFILNGHQVSTSTGGITSPYAGIFTSTNTSSAVSTTTGALQVAGGVGIGGNLYVGGIVTATTFVGSANLGTTSTTAAALGYLGMPQLSTASSYTLVAGDQGKHIYITATAQTITIPANAAVAFPIGTTISLIAGPSATSTTIGITTDTMYLGGTGTTGNRTLAAYGMATLVKVAATTWYINGSGLT